MKLPRTPQQWERLTTGELALIEDASEIAIQFLVDAGVKDPNEADADGDEIGDVVQSHLMDAILRSPKVREYMVLVNQYEALIHAGIVAEEGDEDEAVREFMDKIAGSSITDLRSARTIRESRLVAGFDPEAHWELQIIANELIKRMGKQAFNDPTVPCCGRDAADCDCASSESREAREALSIRPAQQWGPWGPAGREGL
jgi:hypothetical protein